MNDVRETLIQARELLSDESKWGKGALAVNHNGHYVNPHNVDACRWCLAGAIAKVSPDDGTYIADVINPIAEVFGLENWEEIADFNDSDMTSHEHILALLDRNIERLAGV